MKRKSILFLIMIFSISLLGCSDTKTKTKNKIPHSIDTVKTISIPYEVPFVFQIELILLLLLYLKIILYFLLTIMIRIEFLYMIKSFLMII